MIVISLKMAKIINFGVILATNIETNKCPSEMTYLSALGTYWNEYSISFCNILHLIGYADIQSIAAKWPGLYKGSDKKMSY